MTFENQETVSRANTLDGGSLGINGTATRLGDSFNMAVNLIIGQLIQLTFVMKTSVFRVTPQIGIFLGYTQTGLVKFAELDTETFDVTAIHIVSPDEVKPDIKWGGFICYGNLGEFKRRTGMLTGKEIYALRGTYPDLPKFEGRDNSSLGTYDAEQSGTRLRDFCTAYPEFHIVSKQDDYHYDNHRVMHQPNRYLLAKGDAHPSIIYTPEYQMESLVSMYIAFYRRATGDTKLLLQKMMFLFPEAESLLMQIEVDLSVGSVLLEAGSMGLYNIKSSEPAKTPILKYFQSLGAAATIGAAA